MGAALDKAAGDRVRPVPELSGGLENRFAPVLAHMRRAPQHERDQRLRDARALCNVPNRRPGARALRVAEAGLGRAEIGTVPIGRLCGRS
ncbi:hypothetical protein GCM10007964_24370 [Sphaerisporangium melleum]|uniref:Uncharacterized protein n=1 Tax=Sphaerisporangium melleum TaxID=321316 RepID=A0A917R133_9ACTN|nr:hypothetical protein GCM10007964_24370 [Sphaerisporangium melleum]